jgi:HEAT repeat protein
LINAQDAAVALLRDRLPPAAVDAELVTGLIRQLDSPKFADRQAAARELDAVADRATHQLQAALAETKSVEVRRSLQTALDRLDSRTPERLRTLRAVEALEHIGTPAAQAQLRKLAAGAPGATVTLAAAESLKRLQRN